MANEKLFLVPKSLRKKKNKDSYLCQNETALGIIIILIKDIILKDAGA